MNRQANNPFFNKELLVRKKISRFIERLFQYQKVDISHERYKQIVYGEVGIDSSLEEKIKRYYDAYLFLLNNYQNPFTDDLLKRFFYLMFLKEIPHDLSIRLITSFFKIMGEPNIHHAIGFHLQAYKDIVELNEEDTVFFTLMLLNFSLLRCQVPTIVIMDVHRYLFYKNKYLDSGDESIYQYLLDIIMNNTVQNKSYYKNLIPLTLDDVYQTLLNDKDLLKEYGIKHLVIFGSFVKGSNRIDSDIDLMVEFNPGIADKEKQDNFKFLSKYYFTKFHRFIDFTEIDTYLNDVVIKQVNRIKNVF